MHTLTRDHEENGAVVDLLHPHLPARGPAHAVVERGAEEEEAAAGPEEPAGHLLLSLLVVFDGVMGRGGWGGGRVRSVCGWVVYTTYTQISTAQTHTHTHTHTHTIVAPWACRPCAAAARASPGRGGGRGRG